MRVSLHGAAVAAFLAARAAAVRRPKRISTAQRLAALPLRGAPVSAPVRIRWDARQIPWIKASHDTDLAAALGVVHGHLRLGQLDLMRRLALGRLAEIVGPLGVELDRTILLMDLGRAVPAILDSLSDATRAWATQFVAGLNHAIAHAPAPYENRLLGTAPEPWSLADFFTVARLVSADLSWIVASRLLRAERGAGEEDWAAIWPKLLDGAAPFGMEAAEDGANLASGDAARDLLARHMRAGSNSAAVSAWRSASGAGLIASDPHLGLGLPNNWLIAGMKSPSYHAVGLMLPGIPFVALGRNPHIAWGGTSLHAASSELVDCSSTPPEDFRAREVTVRVRGAKPRVLALREAPFGPVVSDGLLLRDERPLALRWVGHAPSDELGAMLGVMRARNFGEFRSALDGFAVPGQMMVCAEAKGGAGKRAAVHMPDRPARIGGIVTAPGDAWDFADIRRGDAMPVWEAPEDGVIASANERPDRGDIPLGFFFSPPDRARRLRQLLAGGAKPDEAALRALQTDTLHPAALDVRNALLPRLRNAPEDFTEAWRGWDGRYEPNSSGALAHELFLGELLTALFPKTTLGPHAVWGTRLLLLAEMQRVPAARVDAAMTAAARKAAKNWRKWRSWGRVHRYRPSHHFAALPVLGRRFRGPEFPAPGGDDTLHKTGHGLVRGPHTVGFGACARHISDMADPDANRFVLLGGQDGWLGSENFADQAVLWQRGEYVTVPMREASVASAFPHETVLRPG